MVINALRWGLFEEILGKLRVVCALEVVLLHQVDHDAGLLVKSIPTRCDQGSTGRDSRRSIIEHVPS